MTVQALAQRPPVLALTTRLGELKQQADTQLANLAQTLKHIDETRALLNEQGITMTVDLGPIGNAAANERRKPVEPRKFALPRTEGAALREQFERPYRGAA